MLISDRPPGFQSWVPIGGICLPGPRAGKRLPTAAWIVSMTPGFSILPEFKAGDYCAYLNKQSCKKNLN